eukprot:2524138-Rhodomonas_salina.1
MHHSLLGQVLTSLDGVTDAEVQSLLQIRGNFYPTATTVSRNKCGKVSSVCPLCHGDDETISHMLMHCPATEAARHRAHDSIAFPLLASVASRTDTGWQYWLQPVAWKISSLLSQATHPPRCRGGWDPDNPPSTT